MLLSSPVVAPASDLTLDLFHPLDLVELVAGQAGVTVRDADDPLQLRAAVLDVRRRSGARGVVDLLVTALTRRSIRDDADIDPYLDELKAACRQTRRWREAMPVFQRVVALNSARRHEMAAELAVIHGHLGEAAKGIALLETAYRGQKRLGARRRSPAFSLLGEVAATVLRQPDLARQIAELGRPALPARLKPVAADALPVITVDRVDDAVAAVAGDRVRPSARTADMVASARMSIVDSNGAVDSGDPADLVLAGLEAASADTDGSRSTRNGRARLRLVSAA